MRVAVISDIHGNCVALDAALQDIGQLAIDRIICLGDVVERGAEPKQSLERVRALGCPVVMGNMDSFLVNDPPYDPGDGLLQLREWTLFQLDQADLSFIASFQATCTVPLDGPDRLLCFHGSPGSFLDVILPSTSNEQVATWLSPAEAFMAGGHTHLQQMRHVGGSIFFNPGSIGMASRLLPSGQRNGRLLRPVAEYAVVSTSGSHTAVEFRRVPYDRDLVAQAAHSGGRPYAEELISQLQEPSPDEV